MFLRFSWLHFVFVSAPEFESSFCNQVLPRSKREMPNRLLLFLVLFVLFFCLLAFFFSPPWEILSSPSEVPVVGVSRTCHMFVGELPANAKNQKFRWGKLKISQEIIRACFLLPKTKIPISTDFANCYWDVFSDKTNRPKWK